MRHHWKSSRNCGRMYAMFWRFIRSLHQDGKTIIMGHNYVVMSTKHYYELIKQQPTITLRGTNGDTKRRTKEVKEDN